MIPTAGTIADEIIRRGASASRFIAGIAGPPGSGKSTLAEKIAHELISRGQDAAVVPMDGFHMDNSVLQEKGLLDRKGAPCTFDLRGLLEMAKALRRADDEILVPLFDRSRELSIAAAKAVPRHTRFVVMEGNYLLLDEPGWIDMTDIFDLSIMILPSEAILADRLTRRWLDLGLEREMARRKVEANDLPNGRLVRARSRKADITLE
ncbi:nucleoside/nucleotide kinase family protein [Rhizobium halophilum]|uniref:nucleoside/nucleotide kinase family protein n=1 Tax=Rhizobium halophilum TaxID=2846852 RepID=UPI001EFDB55E|nr:nucleoside/nucleotide kinase family protein [Rhizobium halophilum]MCF6368036.1 nucleoside/nucleotide kinase family protein [Rhizobium halophilum]